jgi:hypothetical protein
MSEKIALLQMGYLEPHLLQFIANSIGSGKISLSLIGSCKELSLGIFLLREDLKFH